MRPYVTYTFLTLCIAVTVPSLIDPGLYDVFGGIEPRKYTWQLFTAVLEHGWPGFPGIVHLGLNALLIAAAGVPCERLLGSGKFLLLTSLRPRQTPASNCWATASTARRS